MRPAIVLPLVLLAVAALVAALFLTGDKGDDGDRGSVVGPEPVQVDPGASSTAQLTPTQPRAVAEPTQPAVQASGAGDGGRSAVSGGSEGAYSNGVALLVQDPNGAPLEGARIELRDDAGGPALGEIALLLSPDQPRGQVRRTTTDAKGEATYENLPPGRYAVSATHDEFARQEVGGVVVEETGMASVSMKLQPGLVLEGRVTSKDGMPIPGATVTLVPVLFAALPENHPAMRRNTTTTDDQGYYRLDKLDGGARNATASAKGFGSRTQSNLLISERPDGPIVQDFQLDLGFTIAGQVVGSDRNPIEGADVQALNFTATQSSIGRTRTGPDGRFELLDMAPGSYQVRASADGWKAESEPRVEAGTTDVLIVLPELGGALGKVSSAVNGEPLTNFVLFVRRVNVQNGQLGRVERREAIASRDGTYRLGGLDEGDYVIEVEAGGHARTPSARFRVEQAIFTPGVDVALTLGGRLRGVVVSAATGEPIEGARIITQDQGFVRNPLTEMLGSFASRSTTERAGKTNAKGEFELDLLTAHTYQIEISHPKYVTQSVTNLTVNDTPDGTDAGTIRLNAGGLMRGTVTGPAGEPLVGATVTMTGSRPGESYSERTGTDGRFTIPRVAPGPYTVNAMRNTTGGNPFEAMLDIEATKRQVFITENSEQVVDFRIGS